MKCPIFFHALIFICCTTTCLPALNADESKALINRLQQTQPVNMEAIINEQFDQSKSPRGFRVADPYQQKTGKAVQLWRSIPIRDTQVCGVRFVDNDRKEYELSDFESAASASEAGFVVTHQGRCGSCSTLKDLSIYLAVPDLTTPARQCARKAGLKRKKQCYEERIGFTPYCAESWAYNARNTRQECRGACISDYGFLNLVFGRYPGANVDESGQLRPCLQCDEDHSGDGFKFSAGRTRRNSGIKSAIKRQGSEIYPVDHSAYFQ
jgi:hypothetical protein